MTEGSIWRKGRLTRLDSVSLATAVALVAITLLGATGCDTVAQISFPERRFQEVQAVSVHASANSQGNHCGEISNSATFRMVLMANDNTPVKPGEDIALTTVNLTSDDMSVASGRIYSFPDQTCQDVSECPGGGFVCASASGSEELGRRCHWPTALALSGEPRFVGTEPTSQAMALVVSHAGRWRGFLPAAVANLIPVDEQGADIGQADPQPEDARAVDPRVERFGSLRRMVGDWRNLEANVRADGRQAFFGLWSFAETEAEVTSRVAQVSPSSSPWTTNWQLAESSIERLNQAAVSASRSDVYRSMNLVLTQGFEESDRVANVDHRSMVVVVDGHDERRGANISADDIIARANQLGVEITIIQVAAQMDNNMLRDDFVYYQLQPPCSDNSDCLNFEECRQPQFYRDRNTPGTITYPQDQTANYCLPARDENGRIEPVADYQRIACETGGAFHYIPAMTENLLYSRLEGHVMAAEAAWEIDFVIDEGMSLFPGLPYSLEATFEVNMGRTRGYTFSPRSQNITGSLIEPRSQDSRPIFFSPAE